MFSFLDAEQQRFLPGWFELFALTEIGCKGNDLASVGGLQPFQNNRGVEPAGIGENDLLYSLLRFVVGHRSSYRVEKRGGL